MPNPIISICIPTYERIQFLQRLLDSIKIQTVRNFEVIFTDDSKTDIVKIFVESYSADFPLYYYKNATALGTSKNMLEGGKYASSEWIKIIHDDDFFATADAIEQYASVISGDTKFIFSGYNQFIEDTGKSINKTISVKKFERVIENPSILFADNLIGPPSVMMIRKDAKEIFDIRLKWFTDMEYYGIVLAEHKSTYIPLPLVSVSSNDSQVTTYTRTNPEVVIAEAVYLFDKHGTSIASTILAYDSWWRIFRNFGIRSIEDIKRYVPTQFTPVIIEKMIAHQKMVPAALLKNRFISKAIMTVSYLLNKSNL